MSEAEDLLATSIPSAVTEDSPIYGILRRDLFNINVPADAEKAQRIAEAAHWSQTDHSGQAYILHPAAVADLLVGLPEFLALSVREREAAVQAAWLHDTVEDTAVTFSDLRDAGFDGLVIDTVEALTMRAHEPRAEYYARVRDAGPVAVAVKLADLAHNTLPERRELLPGSPSRPLREGESDLFARLGVKYADAYLALGVTVPSQLEGFVR